VTGTRTCSSSTVPGILLPVDECEATRAQIAEVTASNAFPPRQQRDSWQRPVEIMERFAFALEGSRDRGAGHGCFCVSPCGRSRREIFARISAAGVEKIADRARKDGECIWMASNARGALDNCGQTALSARFGLFAAKIWLSDTATLPGVIHAWCGRLLVRSLLLMEISV